VSDNSPWQSPDSGSSANGFQPVAPPTPAASETLPPPTGAPQFDGANAAPQYGAAAPTWTPPPKPGLIPLRPLGFGTLLSASLMVLRRNPRPIFGLAILMMGAITVTSLVLVGIVAFASFERANSATGDDVDVVTAGAFMAIVLSALFTLALSMVGGALLQGVVSIEVARGTLGERLTLKELVGALKGRFLALLGWSALLSLATIVGIVVVAVVAGLLFSLGNEVGALLGILAMLGGFLILFAIAVTLGTFLVLVPSALVIERLPLRLAIRRSWSLVTGSWWRTFGLMALVIVIVQVVANVVSAPLSIVATLGGSLINPTGNIETTDTTLIVVTILSSVISLVFSAITIILQSAAPALVYIDRRMRKEGFDLELTRFVEARSVGNTSLADPYLTAASTTASSSVPAPHTAS